MAEILTIEQKCKAMPVAVASPADFSCTTRDPIDPYLVLRDPNISLYCLDHARRQALFVETDDGYAAAEEPFLYLAQYNRAQRLRAVSYETLARLADAIKGPAAPLALIHSPGRSGSTLLNKAFQRVEATTSLSEPDAYSQIVQMRAQGIAGDDELVALLRWTTLLLFKPVFTRGSDLWVVTFRSWCIEIADLLIAACPQAKNLFPYRDLRPWLVSSARAFFPLLPPEGSDEVMAVATSLADFIPLLKAYLAEPDAQFAPIEVLTLMWLSVMRRYAEWERWGIAMHAIRYEDMAREPERIMDAAFRYIGLPGSMVGAATQVFGKDSQEGTFLSRDVVGSHEKIDIQDRQWEQVRALCSRYPVTDGHETDPPRLDMSSAV